MRNQETSHTTNQTLSKHTQLNDTTTNLNHSQGILNQLTSAKKIRDLTNYVNISQSYKILDTKVFFTPLKSSQQIKQISSKL